MASQRHRRWVARELNRRGFATTFGKRFNATAVRRTVSNRTYAGDLSAGRRRRGKFRSLHDEGGVVCENAHEPLVSRRLFERAQQSMRARYQVPRTTTPVSGIERRLAAVREKIERGTENLALANREDVPGISRLLAGWRDEESRLKAQLQQAQGEGPPPPEALEIIGRLDQLLDDLSQADRERLQFAVRQTVKRITLRREVRGEGRHRLSLWDGVIELRDDLGHQKGWTAAR